MSSKNSPMGDLGAAFELTLKQRDFEIAQLTQRNNFFMIFQGVIIAGLVQSGGTAAPIVNFCVCLLGVIVSIFQTGVAAGAKFWQMRWERASRKVEIWLLDELKVEPQVYQFFTSDTDFLTPPEENSLNAINVTPQRANDPLNMTAGFIKRGVNEDLALKDFKPWQIGRWPSFIVSRIIARKYSVSKLPIYVGMALTAFWLVLWLHTFSFNHSPIEIRIFDSVSLTPLKPEKTHGK